MREAFAVTTDALKRQPFWAGLDEAVLKHATLKMQVLLTPKGTEVVTEGQPSRGVFFVADGLLAFERVPRPSEPSVVFAVAHPGQMFGERSVVDGTCHSASVMAIRDSVLLHLPQKEALEMFLGVPAVALRVMQHLSALLGQANSMRNSMVQRRAGPRLWEILLQLSQPLSNHPCQRQIDVLPTHETLAQLCGLKRETVSRFLGLWLKNGRVLKSGRTLILVQPDEAELELPFIDIEQRDV